MRIEHLGYLVSFEETGSVSAAARRHFMTEQGMSRALRQLEKDAGVPLFARKGKGLVLTGAGEGLVSSARAIVAEYEEAAARLGGYVQPPAKDREVVDLFATPLSALCVLPLLDLQSPRLFDFTLNVYEEDLDRMGELAGPIRDGGALALASVPPGDAGEALLEPLGALGLSFRELLSSEVVAFVSTSSPLARERTLPPSRFRGYGGNVGVACLNDRAAVDQVLGLVRRENLRLVTNNMKLIKRQIRNGQAVACLPDLAQASMHVGSGMTCVRFDAAEREAARVRFGLVTAQGGATGAAALVSERIAEALEAFVAQQDDEALTRLSSR